MKKLASTFPNMVLSLTIIVFVSSGSLAMVYSTTKDAIEKSMVQAKVDSLKAVLPEFDNNPLDEKQVVTLDGGDFIIYPARKDGKVVGVAVESFTMLGYGGKIVIMVGFLPSGEIKNIAVLEHKETPGLGTKIAS